MKSVPVKRIVIFSIWDRWK